MLHEVFQNPRSPYEGLSGSGFTLQIHSKLPDQVKVGGYQLDSIEPVVEEVVSRREYLDRIQQACAEHGEAYTVRFYDHLDDGFDAAVLDELDEIRTLTIEVNCPVANPEAIGRLPKLTGFSFAPRGTTRRDVLRVVGAQRFKHLTLSETATPPLDLSPLADAQSLQTLRLLARGDNTEAVGHCSSLTELAMHPAEKIDLGFIGRLPRLETLKFTLGKLRSLERIRAAPALRDLSFHLVNLLDELGDMQRFPALRRLQIQQQKRLKAVRVGPGNAALEHISAEGLDEIVGLSELPSLRSLSNFGGTMEIDWEKLPKTLTHFEQMPTSMKARQKHEAEVRAHGLIPEQHPEAGFFYK